MKKYRYVYTSGRLYNCPGCGRKVARRFIDTTTGELMPETFAVCNRINSCGYTHRPRSEKIEYVKMEEKTRHPFYLNKDVFDKTQNSFDSNVLFKYLCSVFAKEKVVKAFEKYKVGTGNFGDCVFWQIDEMGWFRTAKRIQYFSNGKRNKCRNVSWLHTVSGFDYEKHELKQCLFGQHLLKDKNYEKIYIVESEKTAIICEICNNDKTAVFLATGGLQNFARIKGIRDIDTYSIFFVPDNDANEIWTEKKEKIKIKGAILQNDELNKMKKGSDIADLILSKFERN